MAPASDWLMTAVGPPPWAIRILDRQGLPLGSGEMPVAAVLEAATAAELAVLEFDDYAGDLFEGLAAGRAFADGLGVR